MYKRMKKITLKDFVENLSTHTGEMDKRIKSIGTRTNGMYVFYLENGDDDIEIEVPQFERGE